jgi:hypothetical protein
MSEQNPWAERIAAAERTIARVEEGSTLDAQDVLLGAAIGLRDLLGGRLRRKP